jgi:hypothetical protein
MTNRLPAKALPGHGDAGCNALTADPFGVNEYVFREASDAQAAKNLLRRGYK